MKRSLQLIGLVVVVAALVLAGGWQGLAQAQTATPTPEPGTRTVTTSGMGQVQVQPDTAVINLGVQVESEDAAQALDQASQQAQAVIDALQQAGVAEEDIQTQAVRLSPRMDAPVQPQTGTPQLTGFIAANIVQVRVADLSQLGSLINTAVDAGANVVENISFAVSQPGQVQDQALQLAFQDAEARAQTLAGLAGAELGEVQTISTLGVTPLPFGAGGGLGAAEAAVPIEPGQQAVTAQVQVTWLLVPAPAGAETATPTPAVGTTGTPTAMATARPTGTPTTAAVATVTRTPTALATGTTPTVEGTAVATGTPLALGEQTVNDLQTTVDALEATGIDVVEGEQVEQPFFPVNGQILTVAGEEVQVFVFDRPSQAIQAASLISSDGSTIANTSVNWVAPPHFFRQANVIALYVGENPDVIEALTQVFGEQFAGQ